jgi:hypothetical protein
MEIATFTRLARAPTAGLIEHLAGAAAANKLALVEAVRLELQRGADREGVKDRFAAAFPKVALPQCTAATKLSAASGPLRGSARSTSTRRSMGGRTQLHGWRRLGSLRLKRITRCDGWANTYSGAGRQQRAQHSLLTPNFARGIERYMRSAQSLT